MGPREDTKNKRWLFHARWEGGIVEWWGIWKSGLKKVNSAPILKFYEAQKGGVEILGFM